MPAGENSDKAAKGDANRLQPGAGPRLANPSDRWFDPNPQAFTRAQRAHTTLLFGGLTRSHDLLIGGALDGLGYHVQVLDEPDADSLSLGKEFGNRGQCNPTYFTVGNLIKFLKGKLAAGETRDDVVENYVFVTVGACGPCRFGTYATEYRKALRDAGFDGFRVLLLDNNGGLNQAAGTERGLILDQTLVFALLRAVMIGDILNVMGYRMRPYEVEEGATDRAMEDCRGILRQALSARRGTLRALWRCRKILDRVELDRLVVKPKVSVIGEFWAMTTEGDGNYRLQRFLEEEGAEVDGQMVMAWVMYQLWQNRWDTHRRMLLPRPDHARMSLGNTDARKKLILLSIAKAALHGIFGLYARAIGLRDYHLPDMDEMAELSNLYYDNHLRGGEGHMEVGKVIQYAVHRKTHMVISVKPFGCMPSSGISDGIQSKVSELHPEMVFCAVETTGDAAVILHSRVQMHLFRAAQAAREEYALALRHADVDEAEAARRIGRAARARASAYRCRPAIAGTAAALVDRLGESWLGWVGNALRRSRRGGTYGTREAGHRQ